MSVFWALVRRDVALAVRRGGEAALTLGFFVITIALFPFGVGPEPELLGRIAAGIIWVTALLAATISLDRLFRPDFDDGSLDLLALSSLPLELVVLAKCLAHWLITGLPVALLAPLMALMLQLDTGVWPTLILSLLIGTPAISLIGAIGASLVLGARRGGALIGLLVLPLFVPVLIFGISAVEAHLAGLPALPHILIETAILIVSVPLAAFASAGALRLAME
ncbi:MAG: heme exporter protein CcmB [Rhodospirillaceae bacterium]|nr:heme exporter protein CcmB [Rhodospirillaceae bacterium]|tara:strand:+ start:17726 stop:18391 length:666 start_codon:yes stop_codon:yes gene_type:complete